jgi:protein-L-isoaspartate O-methyltransferase
VSLRAQGQGFLPSITVAPFTMDASWTDFAEAVGGWQRDREVAGSTTLMIGHSGGYNTTLLRRLGADVATATGERYEELVILVRQPDGTVSVSVESYGGESSLDP